MTKTISKLTLEVKKTKRRKGRLIGIKSRFAKRNNPTSRRIVRLNKNRLKPTRRSTAKRRSMK